MGKSKVQFVPATHQNLSGRARTTNLEATASVPARPPAARSSVNTSRGVTAGVDSHLDGAGRQNNNNNNNNNNDNHPYSSDFAGAHCHELHS
eukprot:1745321-Prymnesium_polylepis.1